MKHELPKGMRLRKSGSGRSYYYLRVEVLQTEIHLGADLRQALAKWREYQLALVRHRSQTLKVTDLLDLFTSCEVPAREPRLRPRLRLQINILSQFFRGMGNPAPGGSLPNEREYQAWRGPTKCFRAGGEIRLFIHVWGWASTHSLIQAVDCPWASASVQLAYQGALLKELGDVLAYYSAHPSPLAGSLPAEPVVCGEMSQSNRISQGQQTASGHPDEGEVGKSGAANGNALPDLYYEYVLCNDAELESLRRRSVKSLRLDGRPDLAKALADLTLAQVRVALSSAYSASQSAPSSHLILGTGSAEKLRELARKRTRKHATPVAETRPRTSDAA